MNSSPQGLGLISRRNLLQAAGLGGGLLLAATGASAQAPSSDVVVTIKGAKVFDGRWVLEADTVIVEGSTIVAVGRGLPPRGKVIEGAGATLLPGLIDSHTHIGSKTANLRDALLFGVTTELEMGGEGQAEAPKRAGAEATLANFAPSFKGGT